MGPPGINWRVRHCSGKGVSVEDLRVLDLGGLVRVLESESFTSGVRKI